MKYRLTKRSLISGSLGLAATIACIYFAFEWINQGMPIYSNVGMPGSKKEFLPFLSYSIASGVGALIAAFDAYIYSREF